MASDVLAFISAAFAGAVSIFERLVSRVPGANDAIVWAIFVSLTMSLIILPLRGRGMSDIAGKISVKSKEEKSDG